MTSDLVTYKVSSANKSAPPSAVKSAPLILKILFHYFLLIIRFHISCSVTGTINPQDKIEAMLATASFLTILSTMILAFQV